MDYVASQLRARWGDIYGCFLSFMYYTFDGKVEN